MINLIPYEKLGGADHGWLKAKHHFSFASYQDPNRMNFGPMRVINDDIVAAQKGFAPHPHDNMEIITYVRKGAITHKDNMGNEGRTAAGDVQVMSAGTGVTHSEYNLEDEETSLFGVAPYRVYLVSLQPYLYILSAALVLFVETNDGCYPLYCPMVSGLSSPRTRRAAIRDLLRTKVHYC